MSFACTVIQGQQGEYRLSDPRPEVAFSKTDVDRMRDTWFTDQYPSPRLQEGMQHPLFPGLILFEAVYDEYAPAFPATPEMPTGAPGDYRVSCMWLGDARGKTPTKFFGRSSTRQIAIGFDEFTERYISWNAAPMAVTGSASGNLISHPGNAFADGDAVAFTNVTGSAIVGLSGTTLPTTYYVINRTADGYQISATRGGSALSLGTNLTAGYIADARFVIGTAHPTWAGMIVANVVLNDDVTNWRKADVQYVGQQTAKPGYRIVTCNGVSMSSSEPISWSFTDGWSTPENSNVQLPEVGVEDTFLAIGTINTNLVPGSSGEVGEPTDAPSVRSVFIFGDDSTIVYNWPNGWSLLGVQDVQTVNVQSGLRIAKASWRYCWPFGLK